MSSNTYTKNEILQELASKGLFVDTFTLDTFFKIWKIDAIFEDEQGNELFDTNALNLVLTKLFNAAPEMADEDTQTVDEPKEEQITRANIISSNTNVLNIKQEEAPIANTPLNIAPDTTQLQPDETIETPEPEINLDIQEDITEPVIEEITPEEKIPDIQVEIEKETQDGVVDFEDLIKPTEPQTQAAEETKQEEVIEKPEIETDSLEINLDNKALELGDMIINEDENELKEQLMFMQAKDEPKQKEEKDEELFITPKIGTDEEIETQKDEVAETNIKQNIDVPIKSDVLVLDVKDDEKLTDVPLYEIAKQEAEKEARKTTEEMAEGESDLIFSKPTTNSGVIVQETNYEPKKEQNIIEDTKITGDIIDDAVELDDIINKNEPFEEIKDVLDKEPEPKEERKRVLNPEDAPQMVHTTPRPKLTEEELKDDPLNYASTPIEDNADDLFSELNADSKHKDLAANETMDVEVKPVDNFKIEDVEAQIVLSKIALSDGTPLLEKIMKPKEEKKEPQQEEVKEEKPRLEAELLSEDGEIIKPEEEKAETPVETAVVQTDMEEDFDDLSLLSESIQAQEKFRDYIVSELSKKNLDVTPKSNEFKLDISERTISMIAKTMAKKIAKHVSSICAMDAKSNMKLEEQKEINKKLSQKILELEKQNKKLRMLLAESNKNLNSYKPSMFGLYKKTSSKK